MTKLLITIFLCITSIVFAQNKKALSLPEKDFEKFWTTFKDNYAFFDLKGISWDDAYIQYRNQVTATTTQEELISILGKMVDPLQDGHITISKGDDIVYKNKKPSAFKLEFKGIEKELWKTSFKTLENEKFRYLSSYLFIFRLLNSNNIQKSPTIITCITCNGITSTKTIKV